MALSAIMLTMRRTDAVATCVKEHAMTSGNPADHTAETDDLIETDSLIEEVSIDGMCGVY